MSAVKRLKAAIVGGGVVLLALAGQTASAAPVFGGQLTYAGGNVTVTTLPVSSGYVSELGLYDGSFTRLLYLVNDEPAGVSVTFDPSLYGRVAGDELIFGIRVLSDSNREYFMGPAGRNPDNFLHNIVDGPMVHPTLGNGYRVGFEDLFGGGDQDYDDNVFFFQGGIRQQVPEPGTLALLAMGLGGLRIARRRRTA